MIEKLRQRKGSIDEDAPVAANFAEANASRQKQIDAEHRQQEAAAKAKTAMRRGFFKKWSCAVMLRSFIFMNTPQVHST